MDIRYSEISRCRTSMLGQLHARASGGVNADAPRFQTQSDDGDVLDANRGGYLSALGTAFSGEFPGGTFREHVVSGRHSPRSELAGRAAADAGGGAVAVSNRRCDPCARPRATCRPTKACRRHARLARVAENASRRKRSGSRPAAQQFSCCRAALSQRRAQQRAAGAGRVCEVVVNYTACSRRRCSVNRHRPHPEAPWALDCGRAVKPQSSLQRAAKSRTPRESAWADEIVASTAEHR